MTKQQLLRELEILAKAAPGSFTESTRIEGLEGWDSLKTMEFRLLVEEELGRDLDGLKVERARTISDLTILVEDLLEADHP